MQRALIYSRVSTVMQETGDSLHFQIEKCKDFCQLKGYEVYKILEDVESGAVDDREGFLKLQEEMKRKTFDVLVVYESSRISRRTLTMLNFILELEKSNIKFISISQPELDTTTPTGALFFQIQASLGEYERKQISGRVKSSKFQRAKAGKFQGGNLPLGYIKRDNQIMIDENSREEVIGIFQNYVESKSLSAVGKLYNKHLTSIKWILENTFYIGMLPYGRKEYNINTGETTINKEFNHFRAEHEPIISRELFEQVQEIMKASIKTNRNKSYLLFSGFTKCYCGGTMYQQKQKKHKTDIIVYKYKCQLCNATIGKKKLESKVIKEILSMNELEELNEVKKVEKSDKFQINQSIIKKADIERERTINLYTKGLIDDEELEIKLGEIKTRRERATEQIQELKELENEKENLDNVRLLKSVIENMDMEDTDDLRKIFKLMIKKITLINREPLEIKIYI